MESVANTSISRPKSDLNLTVTTLKPINHINSWTIDLWIKTNVSYYQFKWECLVPNRLL